MTWSSQVRVTRTIKLLRVIGLQARVSVESNEIQHFPMSCFAVKWRQNAMCDDWLREPSGSVL